MIRKLPEQGEWSQLIRTINEIIDVVNALPQTGFSSQEAEDAALDEAIDPHN